MAQVTIGLDLGTSGLKALALGADGKILAQAEADCGMNSPHPGWAETDPSDWTSAVESVLTDLRPHLEDHDVAAVGIDAQMHGVVLVDADGRPTRPAVLWPDRRAEEQTALWRDLADEDRARLANPISAGMAGPILAWLGDHESDVLDASALALQPKDFVRSSLGGPPVTERSDASATLLWDVVADDWARDIVQHVGIPTTLLPQVRPSDEVVAEGVDLPDLGQHDVALVSGAADTAAALFACGGVRPGQVHINLGTGAQVTIGVSEPQANADAQANLFADADGGWYAMAAVQNAGLALSRVRNWLAMDWEDFFEAATDCDAGAGGVSMLPFLSGERSAIASTSAKGAWIGLTTRTTREQLARAAVEGVAFTLARAVSQLDDSSDAIRLTGGGARQPLLPQLLADITQRPVEVIRLRSPSALGAALLAARGVGLSIPTDPHAGSTTLDPHEQGHLAPAFELWDERRPLADY
ncbi:MAG: FGGY family carbohydrate kinase [Ornithinimicrobium sp.]